MPTDRQKALALRIRELCEQSNARAERTRAVADETRADLGRKLQQSRAATLVRLTRDE